MLQVRLPAEFLVEYLSSNMHCWAGIKCEGKRDEGAGAVVLCPYLGEVHKEILLWGNRCPMPPDPLQALLVNS